MSCSVCAGYSSDNCPCCGTRSVMVECPDCDGGYEFYAFDIRTRKFVRVTEMAYNILPIDEDEAEFANARFCQGDVRMCATCKGEGQIHEDY